MRSLERHREDYHSSLIPLTPITFDFSKISCLYGGSYYVTIAVVFFFYQPKTSELFSPSMPMSHRHFLQVSLPLFRVCSPFIIVISHYQTAFEGRCSYLHQHTTSFTVLHFELHDTSMGHAHLVCIQIFFFFSLEKDFGSHSFPSPSSGLLLQFLSTLFITMALSVKETLMYFDYTYAPNLTHQGASVIIEILSATLHANGYRNTTIPNNY
jgi:hypothetical protein